MDAMVWENLQTLQGGLYCRKMPMSDQDRVSSYYIYTISCRQVMRIKKNINYGITN